jgi:outer membrane protein, adhesin transport system
MERRKKKANWVKMDKQFSKPHNLHAVKTAALWLNVAGVTLLLAGCADRPVDMQQMSQDLTATLAQTRLPDSDAGAGAVNIALGFAQALRDAVEANDGYQAARALELEALGRIGVASSARRPQVTGNANLGALKEFRTTTPDTTTTGAAGGMNISQLLYDGGQSTAAVNQATAEALAAQAERALRGNELALQAAQAWIDSWQFGERLRLLRTRAAQMDTMVGQMERMAANGFVDRAALDSARRQIVDITLEETRLQADLREAQVRFQRFYHSIPNRLDRPADVITQAQALAAADAWQQAPALERSAAELLIARSAVATAEASFRPRARLQAGVTSPMQDGESTDASLGLVVEYTFGDGGRRQSQLASAQARAQAVAAQLVDAQQSLDAELDAAVTRLNALDRSMPLVAEQLRLSASEAETVRSQIATGQANLRQLVDAEIENYRAQDRQIAMHAERQILQLTIAARTGALGRRIGLTQGATR